jgi:hypothetical protein
VEESLDAGAEQIMMLNNGCLCCTVRDDLVTLLNTLVRARAGPGLAWLRLRLLALGHTARRGLR